MCNELYEEKGLTERVDARSYEERGIDKIPMVHEGPNVQAMEARGISTALGSLNRLIRALNDMKERAKNLLQWSLFRQSQLMERMLFLHQPTLADYLRNYYDKRNAVAGSYAYGTQKAKNTNLKTICRDDPLSGRAGCENPRTADRENPGIRYSAKRGKSAVESTTVCFAKLSTAIFMQ